jgi:hypothetical protein
MVILRRINSDDVMPRGYGVAYLYELSAVCAPIPLNILIACWFAVYRWLQWRYGIWRHTDPANRSWRAGYHEGQADANRAHAKRAMERN